MTGIASAGEAELPPNPGVTIGSEAGDTEAGGAGTVEIDYKRLFTLAGKLAVDAALGSWASLVKGALDLPGTGAQKAPPPTAAGQCRLLINRALARALAWTIRTHSGELARLATEQNTAPFLQKPMPAGTYHIDHEFFQKPAQSPLFKDAATRLHGWLEAIGVSPERREIHVRDFGRELAPALDLEEREHRGDYAGLAGFFAPTQAGDAAKRQRNWRRYRGEVIAAVRKPLFNLDEDESWQVSLSDLYVPLRGYWEQAPARKDKSAPEPALPGAVNPGRGERVIRHVVWLHQAMRQWFDAAKAEDYIRILSGDPGCGKSSFARMFACDLARDGHRVLYVPLHRFDFQGDAKTAIRDFANLTDELGHDPLTELDEREPLLLIFDGLDELSKSGGGSGEAARDFVSHLDHCIATLNNGHPRVLVLLAGRPVVTADSTASHRDQHQKLHALRYVIPKPDEHRFDYRFGEDALQADQRNKWWQRFGAATGRGFTGLPEEYKDHGSQIDEITEQPLLNYLLALLHSQPDKSGKTRAKLSSVHGLYQEMFDHIQRRSHRRKPGQAKEAIDDLPAEQYPLLMEEIALAAWHTGDRAVSYADLEAHFRATGQAELLHRSFGSLGGGVKVMLNSFFMQPQGGAALGHCEFTHKSFREYLTARRLVRALERFHAGQKFLNHAQILGEWFALTGPSAIDWDLLVFLRAEIAARPTDAQAWLPTLTALFNTGLREGVPPTPPQGLTTRTVRERCRNAEEALLSALNACALAMVVEGEPLPVIELDWGGDVYAAGNLLHRLRGQSTGIWNNTTMGCLSFLNLSRQVLAGQDLISANLLGAKLDNTVLYGANLAVATLAVATLAGATLTGANLTGATLTGANLEGTNLGGANLNGANLKGANLTGANLTGANLEGTRGLPRHLKGKQSPTSTGAPNRRPQGNRIRKDE